jgi:hypothetical protein
LAKAMLPHVRGQLFGRAARHQSRDFHSANLAQRAELKRRNKPAPDDAVTQWFHVNGHPFDFLTRRVRVPDAPSARPAIWF